MSDSLIKFIIVCGTLCVLCIGGCVSSCQYQITHAVDPNAAACALAVSDKACVVMGRKP